MATKAQKQKWQKNWESNDPERFSAYRARNLEGIKAKYRNDPEWRQRKKEYAARRWREKKDEISARRKANPRTAAYNTKYNTSETRRREYRRRLLAKHGLGIEDFDRMALEQNNSCAICRSPPAPNARWKDSPIWNLKIDHDHASNHVRGLLCHHCNVALGLFKDSCDLLRKAADYLESRSQTRPTA